MPPRAPFATPTSSSFVDDLITLIEGEANSSAVANWIRRNASRMDESMFSDEKIGKLEPLVMLSLRAYAPQGVFTQTAMREYLPKAENQDLIELRDALFSDDDRTFFSLLPWQYNKYKSDFRAMMKIAYDMGLRPTVASIVSN